MRKLIILAASFVALAALIATPFANAATTDANGVVTVTKGDIQSAMGWNNAAWETTNNAANGVATLGNLITTSHGSKPVDVPGGWLTLNGQIVANYPSDEYYATRSPTGELGPERHPGRELLGGRHRHQGHSDLTAQHKVTGFKVSAAPTGDGYVYYTRHTTYTNPEYAGAT